MGRHTRRNEGRRKREEDEEGIREGQRMEGKGKKIRKREI